MRSCLLVLALQAAAVHAAAIATPKRIASKLSLDVSNITVDASSDTVDSTLSSNTQFCNSCVSGSSIFQGSPVFHDHGVHSPEQGMYFLVQNDGNIVLYDQRVPNQGCAIWDIGVTNVPNAQLSMQGDGNLVVYDGNNHAYWSSGTANQGQGPYCVAVQEDSNLVVYDSTCKNLWQRNNFPSFRNCPVANLAYHQGGDVMSRTANGVNIYPMFLGTGFPTICDQNNQNCDSADKMAIKFLKNIVYYPWFNTLIQYSGLNNDYIHPRVNVFNPMYDPSVSSNLPDGIIQDYLSNVMIPDFHGGNPDPDGIYLFITGTSVTNLVDGGGDFTEDDGWHGGFNFGGVNTRYMVVSQGQGLLLSTLAHELAESLTDPGAGDNPPQITYYAGFPGPNLGEIADLCQGTSQVINSFPGSPYFPLVIQTLLSVNDGYLCVSQPAQVARTCTSKCPAGSSLYNNNFLTHDQSIVSPNGAHQLLFQSDGNVVLYKNKGKCAAWSSVTFSNHSPASLAMQADGNLVAYFFNQPPWSTGSQLKGEGPYCLTVEDSSNLVIYDAQCNSVWHRPNFPDQQGC